MKIIVTGAGGQLAHDLSPLLARAGHEVAAFDRAALDITDAEKSAETISGIRPGVVINCAAYTKVDLAEKERAAAFAVNRDGARNLAAASKKAGAALVHVSTDFVFDGKTPAPYRETDPVNPLGVYGASKLAGEDEIRASLPEHMIVRTSWLYGTGGGNFVKTILKYAGERDNLRVVYDQVGSPTWTADLAGALVRIVGHIEGKKGGWGTYHYSNEGVASWYDFADLIVEEAKKYSTARLAAIEPILTAGYPTPATRPAYSVFDKEKIKKTFDMTIPHWRISLRKMIKELQGGGHA